MKMNLPHNPPPAFQPLFCAAHHRPAQMTQFVVQINPPFQFVGLLSVRTGHHAEYPSVSVHIYEKLGWPKHLPKAVDDMKIALVAQLHQLFEAIPATATVEAIDTGKTTCDLDPYIEYLYCESQAAGLETDSLVYVRRPWSMFTIDLQDTVQLTYTENPHYVANATAQPQPDPTFEHISDPAAFVKDFNSQLDRLCSEDIPEEL